MSGHGASRRGAGGSQTEVGTLRRVALKAPVEAFGPGGESARRWRELGWTAPPRAAAAGREHRALVALLESLGAEVVLLPSDPATGLDSLYVRDAAVACRRGLVLAGMGKAARSGEPGALGRAAEALGVPVWGEIDGDARLEGGDVAWVDEATIAVGRGYRTDDAGIRGLRQLLGDEIEELLEVPLPHYRGPGDVFHLMSIFSPVDIDLAVVYSPLMPVPFREALLSRGIELVEVPEEELESMGCNVLAVAPRVCVALEGNPRTRERLEGAGATVHLYAGAEISSKGSGGPTCLTRPLWRDPPR